MRLDLNHFEARVTAIEAKLIGLEGRTTALELEQSALRASVIEQAQQFDLLNRSIRALTASVDRLVDDRVPMKMLSDRAMHASERAAQQAETAAQGSAQILQYMHLRCPNCKSSADEAHDRRAGDDRRGGHDRRARVDEPDAHDKHDAHGAHDERTVIHHTDGHGS